MGNKYSLKNIIKILIPYLKKYTLPFLIYFIQSLISIIIINSIDLTIPFFTKHFIDAGLIGKELNIAIKFTIIILFVGFFNQFFKSIRDYLYGFICAKYSYNVELYELKLDC